MHNAWAEANLTTKEKSMSDLESSGGQMAAERTKSGQSGDYRSRGAREDNVTARIESQTSKIPSTGYLGAALGAMAVSAVLNISGKKHWSLFVGQWAAPFLLMGIYNKMVKQHGSDIESRNATRASG